MGSETEIRGEKSCKLYCTLSPKDFWVRFDNKCQEGMQGVLCELNIFTLKWAKDYLA